MQQQSIFSLQNVVSLLYFSKQLHSLPHSHVDVDVDVDLVNVSKCYLLLPMQPFWLSLANLIPILLTYGYRYPSCLFPHS